MVKTMDYIQTYGIFINCRKLCFNATNYEDNGNYSLL